MLRVLARGPASHPHPSVSHSACITLRHALRPGKRLKLTALQSRNEELKALGGDEVPADAQQMQAFRATLPPLEQHLDGEPLLAAPTTAPPQQSSSSAAGSSSRGASKKRAAADSSSEPLPKRGLLATMFGMGSAPN